MVWRAESLNEPALQYVNNEGVPHPDPLYQGWFYRGGNNPAAWEYFRFTANGELEVHHFCTDGCSNTSPLGSPNYCCSSLSVGGYQCAGILMFIL